MVTQMTKVARTVSKAMELTQTSLRVKGLGDRMINMAK